MESNPEQISAVRHIVAGTSRPAPYLIYGPPGTGKTFTMVEAIKQVSVVIGTLICKYACIVGTQYHIVNLFHYTTVNLET